MNAIEVSQQEDPTAARIRPSGRQPSRSALALRLEVRESVEDLKQIGQMVKESLTVSHWARSSPWTFALTFVAIGLYIGSDE